MSDTAGTPAPQLPPDLLERLLALLRGPLRQDPVPPEALEEFWGILEQCHELARAEFLGQLTAASACPPPVLESVVSRSVRGGDWTCNYALSVASSLCLEAPVALRLLDCINSCPSPAHAHFHLCAKLLELPNLPPEVLDAWGRGGLAAQLALRVMDGHREPYDTPALLMWCALARNPSTPPETLAYLAGFRPDRVQEVVYCLARNPSTPPAVVAKLTTARYPWSVRLAALRHPNLPLAKARTYINRLLAGKYRRSRSGVIAEALASNPSVPVEELAPLLLVMNRPGLADRLRSRMAAGDSAVQ